jgi:beta-lactamase superfamily II metal-dependent hydrolase
MGKLYQLDVGCADASLIAATSTFLVDCHDIERHAHLLPSDRHLRGVFVTHQHRDHYSGLAYFRSNGFRIDFLIYSPYERRYGDTSVTREEWDEFNDHRDFFVRQGTETRTPYRQDSWDKPFWALSGVQFWILGPERGLATGETRELHDACLVIKAHLNARKCLFTGDASDANLQRVATITHICDDILQASHHGSINGADLGFIKTCKPVYTVISTEEGVHDSVPHPTALRRYAGHTSKRVFRTDQDGTITTTF